MLESAGQFGKEASALCSDILADAASCRDDVYNRLNFFRKFLTMRVAISLQKGNALVLAQGLRASRVEATNAWRPRRKV